MFETFTDRAKKVMNLAHQRAQKTGSEFVGTDHILLAIVDEGGSKAAGFLKKELGITIKKLEEAIFKILPFYEVGGVSEPKTIPLSPRVKYAIEMLRERTPDNIGVDGLFAAIVADEEGNAYRALATLGFRFRGTDVIKDIDCIGAVIDAARAAADAYMREGAQAAGAVVNARIIPALDAMDNKK